MGDEMTELTSTTEFTGVIPRHRNLFRFPDGVRIGVQSKPMATAQKGWRAFVAHWMAPSISKEPTNMLVLCEKDFDDLDITRTGQPEAYCVLSPGLAVSWPTADRDYAVSVFIGAP